MTEMRVIDQRIEREKQAGKFLYKIDEFLDTELTLWHDLTATVNVWISAGIVLLSSVLYIVAFATTGWGVAVNSSGVRWEYGLWEFCGDAQLGCTSITSLTGAYICCQVFACLALVSLFISVTILILYCMFEHMKSIALIRYGIFFTRVTTSIFLLITFSVYTGTWYKEKYEPPEYETSLSYSYALTVTTFTFEAIASILMAIEMRNQSLEMALREQERLEQSRQDSARNNGGYDAIHEITDPNEQQAISPYEMFQRFTESGQPDRRQQEDTKERKQNSTSSYSGARPKSSDDSANNLSYVRNTHHDNHQGEDDIYHEIDPYDRRHNKGYIRDGNSMSVHADVHPNVPTKSVRQYGRRSKNVLNQQAPLHSYENIPDGRSDSGDNGNRISSSQRDYHGSVSNIHERNPSKYTHQDYNNPHGKHQDNSKMSSYTNQGQQDRPSTRVNHGQHSQPARSNAKQNHKSHSSSNANHDMNKQPQHVPNTAANNTNVAYTGGIGYYNQRPLSNNNVHQAHPS